MYVKALALLNMFQSRPQLHFSVSCVIIIFISCLLVKNLLTSETFLTYYWLLT
jgi:hypothetical protein